VLAKRQREGLGDANRQLSQQLAALQGEQAQLAAALEDAAAANGMAAARLQAAEHNLQHSVRQTKVGWLGEGEEGGGSGKEGLVGYM
jgi:hypothetical protein